MTFEQVARRLRLPLGFVLAALLVFSVRPDPKKIAEAIEAERGGNRAAAGPAAPLSEILKRPGVIPSMVASVVSFGVMTSVMNLTGFVMVQHHQTALAETVKLAGVTH